MSRARSSKKSLCFRGIVVVEIWRQRMRSSGLSWTHENLRLRGMRGSPKPLPEIGLEGSQWTFSAHRRPLEQSKIEISPFPHLSLAGILPDHVYRDGGGRPAKGLFPWELLPN